MRCAVQPGQQRADLPPPPEPRQVEMRTDNAQRSAVQQQFGKYGAALNKVPGPVVMFRVEWVKCGVAAVVG